MFRHLSDVMFRHLRVLWFAAAEVAWFRTVRIVRAVRVVELNVSMFCL